MSFTANSAGNPGGQLGKQKLGESMAGNKNQYITFYQENPEVLQQ